MNVVSLVQLASSRYIFLLVFGRSKERTSNLHSPVHWWYTKELVLDDGCAAHEVGISTALPGGSLIRFCRTIDLSIGS